MISSASVLYGMHTLVSRVRRVYSGPVLAKFTAALRFLLANFEWSDMSAANASNETAVCLWEYAKIPIRGWWWKKRRRIPRRLSHEIIGHVGRGETARMRGGQSGESERGKEKEREETVSEKRDNEWNRAWMSAWAREKAPGRAKKHAEEADSVNEESFAHCWWWRTHPSRVQRS